MLLFLSGLFAVFGGRTVSSVQSDQLYQTPPLRNRPLIVKALPAVENYQSNLYEVYMEPYTYVSHLFLVFHLLNFFFNNNNTLRT